MIVWLMTQMHMMARNVLPRVSSDERAQDTFEYMLIIGGVVVAVIIAVATPVGNNLINAVLQSVCNAIDSIPSIDLTCNFTP